MAWSGLSFRRTGEFRLAEDAARLELLPPELLRAEAAAAGLLAARAGSRDRAQRSLDHARLLREHGARTGAPESLARAARAAEAAYAHGGREADAALEAAAASLDAAELAGDGALLDAVAARLAEAPAPIASDMAGAARQAGLAARLACRRALDGGESAAALEAASACDVAAAALSRATTRTPALAPDLARLRCARAELLVGFALRLRDAALARRAADDMGDLLTGLQSERTPVSHARACRLRGEALVVEGELTACPRRLAEGSRALTYALDDLPPGHAPVEHARIGRALGHAARALAEVSDEPRAAATLDAAAVAAFTAADVELGAAGAPRLRAQIAFERAMALAAAALRRSDSGGRHAAEAALKAELIRRDPRADPSAWAAVQVALARLYAAEPDGARRPQARLALDAALDVFGEAGLRSLADEAAEALRVLGPAV